MIAYVAGTRQNFVKMALPIIADRSQIGQHWRVAGGRYAVHTEHDDRSTSDSSTSDIFLEGFGAPAPDHMLGVNSAGGRPAATLVAEDAYHG